MDGTYQNPLPSLSVCNESSNDWSEEVTSSKKEAIQSKISTSLMCKVDIRDANLTQTLDGRSHEALYYLVGYPLPVRFRVWSPDLSCNSCENREEIDWSFSVLER